MTQRPYLLGYRLDGRHFSVTLWAENWSEAERHRAAIGLTGAIDGELIATIPANATTAAPVGLMAWLFVRLRNFFHFHS